MKIRSMKRAAAVSLLAASAVVALDGCTASKVMTASKPSAEDEAPKKEYQWHDMSTGNAFYGKPKPIPSDDR
jgi:hypothetical protein